MNQEKIENQHTVIDGAIDGLAGAVLTGWAWNKDDPNRPVSISAFSDSVLLGQGVANVYRTDLDQLGMGKGLCAFSFEIEVPEASGMQKIELRETETGHLIAVKEVKFTQTVFDGHIDDCDGSVVTGWAWSKARPNEPIMVAVFCKEQCVGMGLASHYRPDLEKLGFGNGRHAYRIKVKLPAFEEQASLTIRDPDSGVVLVNQTYVHRVLDIQSQLEKIKLSIENIRHGQLKASATGWPENTFKATVFVDGQAVDEIEFKKKDEDPEEGASLFAAWAVPDVYLDAQPHVYHLSAQAGHQTLSGHPSILSYPEYLLHIDLVNTKELTGWTFNASTKSVVALAATNIEDVPLPVKAGIARQDVVDHHPGVPLQIGFTVELSSSWSKTSERVRLIDTETGVPLAEISIASRYATLLKIAGEWANDPVVEHQAALAAVISRVANETSTDLSFSARFLPRVRRNREQDEVVVVIPVYKGLQETIECIESALDAENRTPSKIIVINDNSPDPRIVDYLHTLEKRKCPDLMILHRRENGGFSESVNTGMLLAGHCDVILLNSDTVVQSGWIDRMVQAARSDKRIGTVTPLSNNAEICTVPYTCKSLPIEDLSLATEVDQVAAQVNAGKILDIPVAIGFCMYIKRACLDQIGLFDAATWGRGYGEEVDFCMKAASMGWRHVMTGDTFVVHRGNVSFGEEKLQRIVESAKKISQRYPFYDGMIQRYLALDPSLEIRRNINLALIANVLPKKRILHVSHSYGGGTEQYIKDQSSFNVEDGYTPVVLRFDDRGLSEMTIRLKGSHLEGLFATTHKETWLRNEIDQLKQDLLSFGFERLHLHAPFGMPLDFLEWLVETYPTQVTIHDYAWICPRVTLTKIGARYCEEPPVEQCNRCIQNNPPHEGLRYFLSAEGGDVAHYRQAFAGILAKAEVVFGGAQDVVDRMERHGIHANYKVVPHPHPAGSPFLRRIEIPRGKRAGGGPVRVALIGGISEIKGFHKFFECAEEAERKRLPIEFLVFGTTADDGRLAHLKNVRLLGAYKDEELDELMLVHKPEVAFFPNQWPETYSYTLSHAFRFGVLPIVTDLGAPAERVIREGFGVVLKSRKSTAMLDELFEVCNLYV